MKKKILLLILVLLVIVGGVTYYFYKENKDKESNKNNTPEATSIDKLSNDEVKQVASDKFEEFILGIADGRFVYGNSDTIDKLTYIKVNSIRRVLCDKNYETYIYEIKYTFKCSDDSYCFVVEVADSELVDDFTKTGKAFAHYNVVDNKLSVKSFGGGFTCPPTLVTYE